MKSIPNRLAFILGGSILVLMVIDAIIQRSNVVALTASDQSVGELADLGANNAAALFMVGLIIGTLLGILGFFFYLVRRERAVYQEEDDIQLLLDEVSAELAQEADTQSSFGSPLRIEENPIEDRRPESQDPWERSADWWKQNDDERA